MTLYLVKDNDEMISHCECEQAYITHPPQMDCPWCGCGWLFSCMNCRKAFTFAKAVEVPESLREIGAREVKTTFGEDADPENLDLWVEAMEFFLKDIQLGEQYVVLDGLFIPTSAAEVTFEGIHSFHSLAEPPQVTALKDESIIEDLLANRDYWEASKVEYEEE